MGGKSLKFPSRKKYVAPTAKVEKVEEKPISPEEHEARLKALRDMGLIK